MEENLWTDGLTFDLSSESPLIALMGLAEVPFLWLAISRLL